MTVGSRRDRSRQRGSRRDRLIAVGGSRAATRPLAEVQLGASLPGVTVLVGAVLGGVTILGGVEVLVDDGGDAVE